MQTSTQIMTLDLPAKAPRTNKILLQQETRKASTTAYIESVTLISLRWPNGKLMNTAVLTSSGYHNLDYATASGLSHCSFWPARKGGKPVEASFTAEWVWSLD